MKDYALELASKQEGINAKLNIIREYLQAYTLRVMFDAGMFRSVAFVGGTALRFLHDLPRYSEDLDFFYELKEHSYSFEKLLKKVKSECIAAGYTIDVVFKEKKTAQSAFLKFSGLLSEAGISPIKNQKLSIKVEIDTNPPPGAILKTEIINKFFPISYLTYDVPSLFTGKLHALLSRKYTKGRDMFDLGWYLSRWKNISPNIEQLSNALRQTGWHGEIPDKDNWRQFLTKVVKNIDWKKTHADVHNFLENPADANIFSKENILSLLSK